MLILIGIAVGIVALIALQCIGTLDGPNTACTFFFMFFWLSIVLDEHERLHIGFTLDYPF